MKKITRKSEKEIKLAAERKMGVAAAGILGIGLILIVLTLWLGANTEWMKILGYILMADVVISIVLLSVLDLFKKKGKIVSTIEKVVQWNLLLLWMMIQLVFPSMLILFGLLFVVFAPFSVINILLKEFELTPPTVLFVSLSVGAIISAHYSKPLFAWINGALTRNDHRYEKYFPMLIEYVYKPANIQFVVYFLYVLYLVVSTIYRFEMGGQPIWERNIDLAVLESFLVFVAFSNMKAKHEVTQFRFSELFHIMFAMWTTHDDKK